MKSPLKALLSTHIITAYRLHNYWRKLLELKKREKEREDGEWKGKSPNEKSIEN